MSIKQRKDSMVRKRPEGLWEWLCSGATLLPSHEVAEIISEGRAALKKFKRENDEINSKHEAAMRRVKSLM